MEDFIIINLAHVKKICSRLRSHHIDDIIYFFACSLFRLGRERGGGLLQHAKTQISYRTVTAQILSSRLELREMKGQTTLLLYTRMRRQIYILSFFGKAAKVVERDKIFPK